VSEPVEGYNAPIGPASFLAQAVNRKLKSFYGIKHAGHATERTIRFYATKGLIDKPEKVDGFDGRMAVFGVKHLHQACILLALGPRGYKLASIRRVHKDATVGQMDEMLRLVAITEKQIDAKIVGRNDVAS